MNMPSASVHKSTMTSYYDNDMMVFILISAPCHIIMACPANFKQFFETKNITFFCYIVVSGGRIYTRNLGNRKTFWYIVALHAQPLGVTVVYTNEYMEYI